jgi:hypothetical protein
MNPKNNTQIKKPFKSGRGGRITICVPKEYIGKSLEVIVNFPSEQKNLTPLQRKLEEIKRKTKQDLDDNPNNNPIV